MADGLEEENGLKKKILNKTPIRACLFDIYIVQGKHNFHFNFFDSTIVFS